MEFAIVSTVLFPLLFGVIDYGIYFADVIAVQRGTGAAARSVGLSPATGTPSGAAACSAAGIPLPTGDPLVEAVCTAATTVDPLMGDVHARAVLVGPDGSPAGSGVWAAPNRVRLCVVNDHEAMLPLVPIPNGGRIEARVDMPLEPQPAAGAAALIAQVMRTNSEGLDRDWSWCVP